ncbi:MULTISPECIES: late competence development ComFB family protein [Alkalimonas]|uniref:Late competence development ComFB family protein n=1 Tax=Alkalimonas mucilaginosa TaxID=3057676 RepID=A0ABU7JFX2_9GAMM|nr:late competence development ComFB family protein [Alkalimonas sp. MEB004]MEE2024582.1 late competence development ComFB family protein [Alkalimonas sp. MEB004]
MTMNDDIHNYYEKLVLEYISAQGLDIDKDQDYLADLCCIILNQLPPRYIRYEVDMAFYLPQSERFEMQMKVEEAVRKAVEFLSNQR